MTDQQCESCLFKDLQKLHQMVEKRMAEKLPEGVREPLLEAKKQFRLALRGLIKHLEEESADRGKQQEQTRPIKVE